MAKAPESYNTYFDNLNGGWVTWKHFVIIGKTPYSMIIERYDTEEEARDGHRRHIESIGIKPLSPNG